MKKSEFDYYLKTEDFVKLKTYKVKNAIIMAAGLSSRFKPFSLQKPKCLAVVKGEILIERQIRQLQAAGIREIIVVVGYLQEKLTYLADKFKVKLVKNPDFLKINNTSSLLAVSNYLGNSYLCCADNYYVENPFKQYEYDANYACAYSSEYLDEWFVSINDQDYIEKVSIGGSGYYMRAYAYFDKTFAQNLLTLIREYANDEKVKSMVWEYLMILRPEKLKMRMTPFKKDMVYEFDNILEACEFDPEFLLNNPEAM